MSYYDGMSNEEIEEDIDFDQKRRPDWNELSGSEILTTGIGKLDPGKRITPEEEWKYYEEIISKLSREM